MITRRAVPLLTCSIYSRAATLGKAQETLHAGQETEQMHTAHWGVPPPSPPSRPAEGSAFHSARSNAHNRMLLGPLLSGACCPEGRAAAAAGKQQEGGKRVAGGCQCTPADGGDATHRR